MDVEEEKQIIFQPIKLYKQCMSYCIKHPCECLVEDPYNDDNIVERVTELQGNIAMDVDLLDAHIDCIGKSHNDVDNSRNSSNGIISRLKLKRHVFIPDNICEPLFQDIVRNHSEQFLNLFTDTSKCRMTKVDFSLPNITYPIRDAALMSSLFFHPLHEINLSGCTMSSEALDALKYCASTLKVLDLSSVGGVQHTFVLKELRNLLKLNLSNTEIGFYKEQIEHIGSMQNLLWLDLSSARNIHDSSLQDLLPLSRTLVWLSLFNCGAISDETRMVQVLSRFTNLVHLDLSKHPMSENQDTKMIPSPTVTGNMLTALSKLPRLVSLDISGSPGLRESDLLLFTERQLRLKFLGLSFTGLSFHRNLPAEKVTGEACEEQLLNAIQRYGNRQKYMSILLRKLFNLARSQSCENISKCIELILKSMRSYPKSEHINIAASASLYHLTRQNHPANQNEQLRRDIVEVILASMGNLRNVLQLQKNSCLTLCNFKIPAELEFQWLDVSESLLIALKNHKDDYLRRIAIMLFNTIVCQVKAEITGQQKRRIGKLGAVKTILEIIEEKIENAEPDQLLETCWSSLWNMTDETPENCCDFLDSGGMRMFVCCLEIFPDALELHRNIMGLMGNVAEVTELRLRLMTDEYIRIFVSLLSTETSRLEVSYNAAGLLSHILSDGEHIWTIKSMTRNECMESMFNCIEGWNLQAERNINYRSFKPILGLLPCQHAPAAQHWAIWALANLTKVYPHKYCKLVENEDGIMYLDQVIQSPTSHMRTKQLANIVKDNCKHELCF